MINVDDLLLTMALEIDADFFIDFDKVAAEYMIDHPETNYSELMDYITTNMETLMDRYAAENNIA